MSYREKGREKRQAILDFVWEWLTSVGSPPSFKEIAEGTGFTNIARTISMMPELVVSNYRVSTLGKMVVCAYCPTRGAARCDDVVIDEGFGVARFREDADAVLRVTRQCLCCRTSFLAYGKYNRLCADCTETDEQSVCSDYLCNVSALSSHRVGGFATRRG